MQNKISLDGKMEIVFPKQIEKISFSFVQGFFSTLVSTMGYKEIERKIIIKSGLHKLTSLIIKNIY